MSTYDTLESALSELRRADSREFLNLGKAFQKQLKQASDLTREQRDYFWIEQQSLWDNWKNQNEKRREESKNTTYRYLQDLGRIEFSHDGACMLQSFSDWERVGEKIRYARQLLKNIQQQARDNSTLTKPDRDSIKQEADRAWERIKLTEETTHQVHTTKARQLYNEASSAVECKTLKEAHVTLKALNAEVWTLYLPSSVRDDMKSWFDSLWDKLNLKRDAASVEWRARTEEHIDRWCTSRSKLQHSVDKIRATIASNWDKYNDARSSDFQDTVRGWISEGEDQLKELEGWIRDLDSKIDDGRNRLR